MLSRILDRLMNYVLFTYWLLRDKNFSAIINYHFRLLGNTKIPLLGEYARFKASPSAKEKFQQDACRELDVFMWTGARLLMPRSDKPKITIYLVLFNKPELTYLCLKSLAALHTEEDLEVVMVDNGSDKPTHDFLDRIDGARIIKNIENLGFIRACNQAIDLAQSELILFLNNDTLVYPGSILSAMKNFEQDFYNKPVGAVGARIVLPDDTLQEAGSIIWQDGTCFGYGRGEDQFEGSTMFRRAVDYCSGAFLMTRMSLFRDVGGFDKRYIPAYYEETDYCVELAKRGYTVVYEPQAVIRHFEFGSSKNQAAHFDQMIVNQRKFVEKHAEWLKTKHQAHTNIFDARTSSERRTRLLWIDDRVPHVWMGAGFPRSNCIVSLLHTYCFELTIYSTEFADPKWENIYSDIPEDIEVIPRNTPIDLRKFLLVRGDYYDVVWVSRPSNMQYLVKKCPDLLKDRRFVLVYDAESIFSERESLEFQLTGRKNRFVRRTFASEMALGQRADILISVKEDDVKKWRQYGAQKVHVIGHNAEPKPGSTCFSERQGILFLGSHHYMTSPNTDSLIWFLENCFDKIYSVFEKANDQNRPGICSDVAKNEGASPFLSIATVGYVADKVAIELRRRFPCLNIIGRVDNLAPHLDSYRIMIVPTRYASGIPQKVFDAAVAGLPMVCSELIGKEQLGWHHRQQTMIARINDDGSDFAAACIELYQDESLWNHIRQKSLDEMTQIDQKGGIEANLKSVLKDVEDHAAQRGWTFENIRYKSG